MKILKVILSALLTALLFSQPVYAYNPPTDVKYVEVISNFYLEEDEQYIDAQMAAYAILNTNPGVLDLFTQEGVQIYLTHSVPRYERAGFDGVCYSATLSYDNATKKITKINSPVSIYIYHDTTRVDSYIHECGHALDNIAEYITGYYKGSYPISNSTEWINLYNTYAPTMATFDISAATNVPRDHVEGFAEAYRLYHSYPQQLQSRCPEVYNFVASQIAKYTAYVPPLSYDNFNYKAYAFDYPDVAEAYGSDNKKALWDHYVNYGKAEGRKAFKDVKRKR